MNFPYERALEIRRRYKKGDLLREQAVEQLSFLLDIDDTSDMATGTVTKPNGQSYGPLLRLSDVCNILRLWAGKFAEELPDDKEYKRDAREKFAEAWHAVDLAISKSCLLDRLFFQKEGVRTQPCPEHKGQWSGCNWDKACACQNGSNVTGWLPNPEDIGYVEGGPLCDFCQKPPMKQGLWSSRVDNKHGHPECMDANPYVPVKQ